MKISMNTRKGFFIGFGDDPFTGKKSDTLLIGCGFFRIVVKMGA